MPRSTQRGWSIDEIAIALVGLGLLPGQTFDTGQIQIHHKLSVVVLMLCVQLRRDILVNVKP